MQKGFTLLEMLMVSLFGGLLLLAVSQAIITLIRAQADQSELLRLAENAMLAELVLKKELSEATQVLYIGAASSNNLKKTSETNLLEANNLNNEIKFNQFKNSDWLLLYTATKKENNKCNNKYIIFHIDRKENAQGLAYKYYDTANKGEIIATADKIAVDDLDIVDEDEIEIPAISDPTDPNSELIKTSDTSRSDTLVSQLELLRFRYFYEQEQQWVQSHAILDPSLIKKIQFAFIIATNQPVKKSNPNSFKLWNQDISLPKDGLYRELVTATVTLKGAECLE